MILSDLQRWYISHISIPGEIFMKPKKDWARKQFERHLRHNKHFAVPGCNELILVLDHLKASFNIGKIFRSAEAFGVKEIHIIGTESFPLQSAKGTFKRVPGIFHDSFEDCYEKLVSKEDGLKIFVMDPAATKPLHHMDFPKKSVFVFGHEEIGMSFDWQQYPDMQAMKIAQLGQVESLNVSVAASIVMYEYVRQHTVQPSEK